VLSKVNIEKKKLVWSLSLEVPDTEPVPDTAREKSQRNPNGFADDGLDDAPPLGAICSTPAIAGGRIFAGTTAGYLYQISGQ